MTDTELKIALAIHKGAMKMIADGYTVAESVHVSKEAMKKSLKEAALLTAAPDSQDTPINLYLAKSGGDVQQLHDSFSAISRTPESRTSTRFVGPSRTFTLDLTFEGPTWTRKALYEVMGIPNASETKRGQSNYEWFNMALDPEEVRRTLMANRFYPEKE